MHSTRTAWNVTLESPPDPSRTGGNPISLLRRTRWSEAEICDSDNAMDSDLPVVGISPYSPHSILVRAWNPCSIQFSIGSSPLQSRWSKCAAHLDNFAMHSATRSCTIDFQPSNSSPPCSIVIRGCHRDRPISHSRPRQ